MTIEYSNDELSRLTRGLDEMHRDLRSGMERAVAAIAEGVGERTHALESVARRTASRRTFLAGSAAAGSGLLLAACGGGDTSPAASATAATSAGDLQLARLAASIEVLAVSTYAAALHGAAAGKFGTVPPAVSQFATTAKAQHSEHLSAWNQLITAAGATAVSSPDATLNAMVGGKLASITTIMDVANLSLQLETIAAETYVATGPSLSDTTYRSLAMSIAPVEAQHVAILNFVIGNYPVPAARLATDQARGVADLKQ